MRTRDPLGGLTRCLALALLVTTVYGCQQGPGTALPPPPTVGVAQPVRREVTIYNEYTGATRAVESVEIRARVSGELEQMTFEPSRIVEEDELLFVIEPRPYQAARDEAFAALKSAEADLARAESDLDRVSIAIRTNAVSQADVDLARARRDMAEASVLSAKARLDRAELEYSYTQVRSPISGQVSRNFVDVGNIVGGSDATVLTTVNRLKPIHVYFAGPEEMVLRALRARGSNPEAYKDHEPVPAYVATLADEGYPHEGVIDYVSNTVDPTTGTIELRAVLDNENLSLFPGLFVRVRVPSGVVDDAILIDERAVGTDLGGRYVYLVGEGNVVEQRYVELGPVQEDGLVPVWDGLDGAESYIVEGLLRARPGLPVTPQPAGEAR
jgi:RND family efflux transporter MFP subunit